MTDAAHSGSRDSSALTIYKDKIWKPLPSEAENIDINGSEKAAGQGELRYSAS
jgi:hypothetical protein